MINTIYSETVKGNIKWDSLFENKIEYKVAMTTNTLLKVVNCYANGEYSTPMRLYIKLQHNPVMEEYSIKDVEGVYIVNPLKALVGLLFLSDDYKTTQNQTYDEFIANLEYYDPS